MLPIIDKPIIQYAVEEALDAGINEFIFVTHHAKRAIEDHFDENLDLKQRLKNDGKDDLLKLISRVGGKESKFTFVRQDEPKGLGHAISCAQHLIEKNEYFAVILADDLIINEGKNVTSQLIERVREQDKQALALETVPSKDISKFGVISFNEQNEDVFHLSGIVEKPDPSEAPSDLAVVGRYIFNQSIFNSIDENDIDYYIKKYKPFDKAGSYGIQEWIGLIGINKISGSYSNVVGLPSSRLYHELKRFI